MLILITIWLIFGLLTALSCAFQPPRRWFRITVEDVLLFIITTIGGFVSMLLVLSAVQGWGETILWDRYKS